VLHTITQISDKSHLVPKPFCVASSRLPLNMVKRLTSAGGKARGVVKAPKVIKVGCDFSGMRIMGTAMARMFPSSKYVIKFASDTLDEAHMLAAHKSGNKPEIFYADVLERDLATVPETDVYAWTPPCQSYSTNAAGDGVKDPRGSLIAEGVKYVVKHKPRVAFFENVKGLMGTKHKPVVKGLHNALKRAGYRVHWKILCAKHLAVPQDRHRLIMVALLNPLASRPFAWPTPSTTQVSLNDILDPLAATDKPLRMPPRATSKKLVDIACKAAVAAGVNPKTVPVAVDIDCSLRSSCPGLRHGNIALCSCPSEKACGRPCPVRVPNGNIGGGITCHQRHGRMCQLDSMHRYRDGSPCNCLGHPIQADLDDDIGASTSPGPSHAEDDWESPRRGHVQCRCCCDQASLA
jgi:hypothetical protein